MNVVNGHYRRTFILFFVLQAAVLTIVCCAAVYKHFHRIEGEINLAAMSSRWISYNESSRAWRITAEEAKARGEELKGVVLLYGPYIHLDKGFYTVEVLYACEEDQGIGIRAASKDEGLQPKIFRLSRNYRSAVYHFTVTKDAERVEFQIRYSGKGDFIIRRISLAQNVFAWTRALVWLCLLFLGLDLTLVYREEVGRNKAVILTLVATWLLCSLPEFLTGMRGHDYRYHIMRIEGLVQELRNGILFPKISSLFFDGNGYPSPVYYNEIFLYPAAVLRLLGFSVSEAYKGYMLLINAGTVLVGYFCFLDIFKRKKIAVITTMVYAASMYRLTCLYVRAAVGEYTAMVFIPLVASAIYRIYCGDMAQRQERRTALILLALGMSGLVGSHVLSVEMVAMLLLLIALTQRKTFSSEVFSVYLGAGLLTLLLCLYFIIPFLDYYINVPIRVTSLAYRRVPMIQAIGATLGELISFFQDVSGFAHTPGGQRMYLTPGPVPIFTLAASLILWLLGSLQGRDRIQYLTLLSALALWMSTALFPWNFIAANSRLGSLLAQVQFPWRYLGMACIFLTLLLGELLLLEQGNFFKHAVCVLTVLMAFFFTWNFVGSGVGLNYQDTLELDLYRIGSGEYLRYGTDKNALGGYFRTGNVQALKILSRRGNSMNIHCKTRPEGTATVEVPLLNYKGYHVTDAEGNEYPVFDGRNNVVSFHLPANFDGILSIRFVEPWYWRLGEIISLLSLCALCILLCSYTTRRGRLS